MWVAHYKASTPTTGVYPTYAIWQYTSTPIDLDYFKEQDVAIRCETAKECEELFKILRNYNITWCDGDCLIWDNDWEFIYEDGDCFSLTPNGRLEFCNANWYWKDGFRVVSFRNVIF